MIDGFVLSYSYEQQTQMSINLERVFSSGRLVKDKFVDQFAHYVVETTGRKAVALGGSSTLMHRALFEEMKPCRVTFQANGYPSPAFAANDACLEFRFVDVDPKTGLIDIEKLRQMEWRGNFDLLEVTSLGGAVPPNVLAILDFSAEKEVVLIEDAAHSWKAAREDDGVVTKTGGWADFTVFSFSPTKPMTCGSGGGAVVCDDFELCQRIERWMNYGKRKVFGNSPYEVMGTSARLGEVQAAIGCAIAKGYDQQWRIRNCIALRYDDLLKDLPGLKLFDWQNSSWYKFPVMLTNSIEDVFAAGMIEKNVKLSSQIYDKTIPEVFQKLGMGVPICPGAIEWTRRHVCLPMHNALKDVDVEAVIKAVCEELGE